MREVPDAYLGGLQLQKSPAGKSLRVGGCGESCVRGANSRRPHTDHFGFSGLETRVPSKLPRRFLPAGEAAGRMRTWSVGMCLPGCRQDFNKVSQPGPGPAAREEERPCHKSFLGENDQGADLRKQESELQTRGLGEALGRRHSSLLQAEQRRLGGGRRGGTRLSALSPHLGSLARAAAPGSRGFSGRSGQRP